MIEVAQRDPCNYLKYLGRGRRVSDGGVFPLLEQTVQFAEEQLPPIPNVRQVMRNRNCTAWGMQQVGENGTGKGAERITRLTIHGRAPYCSRPGDLHVSGGCLAEVSITENGPEAANQLSVRIETVTHWIPELHGSLVASAEYRSTVVEPTEDNPLELGYSLHLDGLGNRVGVEDINDLKAHLTAIMNLALGATSMPDIAEQYRVGLAQAQIPMLALGVAGRALA